MKKTLCLIPIFHILLFTFLLFILRSSKEVLIPLFCRISRSLNYSNWICIQSVLDLFWPLACIVSNNGIEISSSNGIEISEYDRLFHLNNSLSMTDVHQGILELMWTLKAPYRNYFLSRKSFLFSKCTANVLIVQQLKYKNNTCTDMIKIYDIFLAWYLAWKRVSASYYPTILLNNMQEKGINCNSILLLSIIPISSLSFSHVINL